MMSATRLPAFNTFDMRVGAGQLVAGKEPFQHGIQSFLRRKRPRSLLLGTTASMVFITLFTGVTPFPQR